MFSIPLRRALVVNSPLPFPEGVAAAEVLTVNDLMGRWKTTRKSILEAIREGASDIHIETQERRLLVRFRVDGVLRGGGAGAQTHYAGHDCSHTQATDRLGDDR